VPVPSIAGSAAATFLRKSPAQQSPPLRAP